MTVRKNPQTCHPRLLDILKFLSSKWLVIVTLHRTGEAWLVLMNLFRKKVPHNLAVLSSSFTLWSDNIIKNSCIHKQFLVHQRIKWVFAYTKRKAKKRSCTFILFALGKGNRRLIVFEEIYPMKKILELRWVRHTCPILSIRFHWAKPGVQWSLVKKWNRKYSRVHLSYRKSSNKMKPEV